MTRRRWAAAVLAVACWALISAAVVSEPWPPPLVLHVTVDGDVGPCTTVAPCHDIDDAVQLAYETLTPTGTERVVLVHAGRYFPARPIQLRGTVKLTGESAASTVIDCTFAPPGGCLRFPVQQLDDSGWPVSSGTAPILANFTITTGRS